MEQVYIFDFGDKIKVGYSTNMQRRLRTIELSSGVKAKQVYAVEASREVEKATHALLENRLEGEFFAFPFDKAKEIVDSIVQEKIAVPPQFEEATTCQGAKFTLRIDKVMAQKLDYIAEYYGRSRSSEIIWAARKHIAEFEREFEKIPLSSTPSPKTE